MRIFLLFFFSIISIIGLAQPKNEFSPADLDQKIIKLTINNELPSDCKFPFYTVKVLDCRADTSKLGFIRNNFYLSGKYAFKKIVSKNNSFASELEKKLNEHYEPCFSKDRMRLLLVLKRFWADPLPNRQVQRQYNIIRSSIFDMYMKVELFFEKDGLYIPFKRIDTLLQTAEGHIPGCEDNKMNDCEMYGYAVSKVFETVNFKYYADRIDNAKNRFTKTQFDSYNNKYNDYPILKDSILHAGVYLNFNDFRANSPSLTNYKVQKVKKAGHMLYDTANGAERQILKYWGYCDGKNIYCGSMQHPLIKSGNTFEFFIDKIEYYTSYGTASGNYGIVVFPTTTKSKTLEPFQIDMETGNIY